MDSLLRNITLNDLSDELKELAETIGIESFYKLIEVYGGTGRLYIPKSETIVIPLRDSLIRREFDGSNYYALAEKWNLTDRYIREIVKEQSKELKTKPISGQVSLF
ncbi:MAG: Mor transcription activator family protein [Oscillospiraceae bacterium]